MTDKQQYMTTYVKVAVPVPVHGTFTYSVPESLRNRLKAGIMVLVPFGPRILTGYVMTVYQDILLKKTDTGQDRSCGEIKAEGGIETGVDNNLKEINCIKEIKEVIDLADQNPVFPESMIPFFEWISSYYVHPVGEVIETALPKGINTEDYAVVSLNEAYISNPDPESYILSETERRVVTLAGNSSNSFISRKKLLSENGLTGSILDSMQKKGIIRISRHISKPKTGHRIQKYIRVSGALNNSGIIGVPGIIDNREMTMDAGRANSTGGHDNKGLADIAGTLSPLQKKALAILKEHGETSLVDARKSHCISDSVIKALRLKGFVEIIEKPEYRDPFGDPVTPDLPPALNEEQQNALDRIISSIPPILPRPESCEPSESFGASASSGSSGASPSSFSNAFRVYLLKGVTGSGKTEVYMNAVMDVVRKGGTAIVLVPEIALISQTAGRFRARFGDNIAVLHSGLSDGERYDQWTRIRNSEVQVVIGARSAIFAPFERPSLIIVDEEHDDSYKQDSGLRYNARDLAVVRGRMCGACVVLGSATPSLQSMFNANIKRFSLIEIRNRVNEMPLPEVRMVDLRAFDKNDPQAMISPVLEKAMKETLARNEQVLIFINRRGHSPFLLCEACGEAVKCRNCDISLTYHQKSRAYKCHMCGFVKPSVSRCESCGSSRIKRIGTGAEKVEEAVRKLFPSASVDRMDQDTTKHKGSVLKILKRLRNRETDILVGTQMVVKGHDFPGITLVGIICADLSLNFPDFRAAERTFQILSQVSGRAGRGDIPGKVIMQTYNPVHYAISVARDQDYDAFYRHESSFRKSLDYPPYTRIAQIRIWSDNEEAAGRHADIAGERCVFLSAEKEEFRGNIIILGPVEASLYRMAGNFRWQIVVKARTPSVLNFFMMVLSSDPVFCKTPSGVRVSFDIDPYFMM